MHSNFNKLVENHFVCVQQFPFSLFEQKCFVLAYRVQYRMLFLRIVCSMAVWIESKPWLSFQLVNITLSSTASSVQPLKVI